MEATGPNGVNYGDYIRGDLKDNVPDEEYHGSEEHVVSFLRPGRWFKMDLPGGYPLFRFNMIVTGIASTMLWCFVIGCAVDSAGASAIFGNGNRWITQNFTWFYIGTNDVWAIFFVWLCFSKYASIKLGKDDNEKPEFSDAAWFAMLFTCGVAIGMFTFGVSEPMYYYRAGYGNRLNKTPVDNDDQRAQQALTVTLFHWGIHGYVPYVVTALAMGLPAYRWGLPLTLRTAFYPLVGDLVKGFLGDLIDAISIACTTFGVCTSLGLGAQTITAGLNKLDPSIVNGTDVQVAVVWVITVLATGSVAAGLKAGIKNLSFVAFAIGMFLILASMMFDNPWFLLNSYVQSIGHYLQYGFFQLGFECDTWEQLNISFKRTGSTPNDQIMQYYGGDKSIIAQVEAAGLTFADPDDYFASHHSSFIDWWTIFYWGWWISWSPFVGMFIAKISRGRTVREIIIGALFAPVTFVFLWLVVFGSLGIKMERVAELALGVQPDIYNGSVDCAAMGYVGGEPVGEKAKALADLGYYALACRPHSTRTYDIFEPYGDTGLVTFMWVMIIIGLTLYFITSSDSGSMVDDVLAAGGLKEPPLTQKIYWAFTEGATCTALLTAGGANALRALQSASIIAGFPYTFAICFMCTSIMRSLKIEAGEEDIFTLTRWNTGLLDFFDGYAAPEKPGALVCSTPVGTRWLIVLRNFVFPPIGVYNVVSTIGTPTEANVNAAGCAALWLTWIALLIADMQAEAVAIIGWCLYIAVLAQVAVLKTRVRTMYKVYGNGAEDIIASGFVPFFVLTQLELHLKDATPVVEDDVNKSAVLKQETVKVEM
mmetsp:Transcript_11529/g.31111  ORF Transcript_11529/g.31111 Transcript_11529/m.31111 type:complete len:820 (-) Transcript_11529:328-2787(-)